MDEGSRKKMASITIIAIVAIVVGLIFYFNADRIFRGGETGHQVTPEQIQSALPSLQSTKAPMTPAQEAKQEATLNTLKASTSTPKIQRSALDSLRAK